MPATRFFALLEACRVLRNQEMVLGCYQARASAVGQDGFNELVDFFNRMDIPQERPRDVELPKSYLKGEAARAALMSVFGQDHRSRGTRRISVH